MTAGNLAMQTDVGQKGKWDSLIYKSQMKGKELKKTRATMNSRLDGRSGKGQSMARQRQMEDNGQVDGGKVKCVASDLSLFLG